MSTRITLRRASRSIRRAPRPLPVLRTLKVVVVGPANTGKTTTLETLLLGTRTTRYVPTVGVEVHPYRVYLKDTLGRPSSQVVFNVWDCAGDSRYAGLGSEHYRGADVAIVVANTREEADVWAAKVHAMEPAIPIVFARAKPDLNGEWNAPDGTKAVPFGRGSSTRVFGRCLRLMATNLV